MATSSQQSTSNMGASSMGGLEVIDILPTTRNQEIWQHYDLCLMSNNSQKARCKLCNKFLGATANSTLRKHIAKFCAALKSEVGSGQSSMGTDCGIWHYDIERVRDRMAKFVIQESLPFDHFDNPRFTALVRETLQPKYKPVSRHTLKRDCLKLFKKAREELIIAFENLQTGINITTDVWSAPHGCYESYICITAHWVNPTTWAMMKRVIAFELFESPHTGRNLFNILAYVFEKFKIQDKIFSISFDNASNNANAVEYLKIRYSPIMDGTFYHSRCMAHIINLAVQDGLNVPSIKLFYESFKNMLKDVFRSSKRRHALYKKLCIDLNSTYLGPNWDVPTRWNSTHHMFECAMRQQNTLKMFHNKLASKGKVIAFPVEYWDTISQLTDFLQAFKISTTMLSGTYYPTSSICLQHICIMSQKIQEFAIKSDMFEEVTFAMKIKLQKYLMELPAVFTCAAALYPGFNISGVETLIEEINLSLGMYEIESLWANKARDKFNIEFKSLYDVYSDKYGTSVQSTFFQQPQSRASSSSSQDPNIQLFNLLRNSSSKRQRGNTPSSEFARYTGTDFLSGMGPDDFLHFDILAWWRGKEEQFPILAAMARDLLTVQASTVASESAFSVSGRVISARRTKLTPTSVEVCICLKDHLDAAERIQNLTSLEEPAPYDLERRIHEEEVNNGEAERLSDEELQMELAAHIGSDEDEVE